MQRMSPLIRLAAAAAIVPGLCALAFGLRAVAKSPAAADSGLNLFGCVHQGGTGTEADEVFGVSSTVRSCPSGPVPVSRSALSVRTPARTRTPAATPTPTPTLTTPTPTAAPTPTPTSTSRAWCTTATSGFFTVPDGKYGIDADEWGSTLPQTVCANTESDWQATFNAPAGNVSILTYPDVQLDYNTSNPAISTLDPRATATFAEDMHTNPGTSAEAAFDIWITGTGCSRCEVMIWTDTFGRGTVGGATDTGHRSTFCGDSTWQLWHYGAELIWYHPAAMPSGTVCPAAMLQDLQTIGKLPANAALSQLEFGWEIASTGGVTENFNVTGYSTTGLPPAN